MISYKSEGAHYQIKTSIKISLKIVLPKNCHFTLESFMFVVGSLSNFLLMLCVRLLNVYYMVVILFKREALCKIKITSSYYTKAFFKRVSSNMLLNKTFRNQFRYFVIVTKFSQHLVFKWSRFLSFWNFTKTVRPCLTANK